MISQARRHVPTASAKHLFARDFAVQWHLSSCAIRSRQGSPSAARVDGGGVDDVRTVAAAARAAWGALDSGRRVACGLQWLAEACARRAAGQGLIRSWCTAWACVDPALPEAALESAMQVVRRQAARLAALSTAPGPMDRVGLQSIADGTKLAVAGLTRSAAEARAIRQLSGPSAKRNLRRAAMHHWSTLAVRAYIDRGTTRCHLGEQGHSNIS